MSLKGELKVIFEKDGLLLIDKPSGLLSQPGRGPELQDSVLTRVRTAFPWAELVHRLDRDTSGLLMLALAPDIHRAMSQAFAGRTVEKKYVGLCSGRIVGTSGTIVCPLARVDTNPPRYAAHPEGRMAVTHWKRLSAEKTHSRLCLIPITGRSHQLRAHLHGIGHPLLGDPIYGVADDDRLMLHAEYLRFRHPIGGEWQSLETQAPF